MQQSGDADTLNEFNRCFYDRPVDANAFPVMRNFNEASVMTQTLA